MNNESNTGFNLRDISSKNYADALCRDYTYLETLTLPKPDSNNCYDNYFIYNLYYTLHQVTEKSLKFLLCLYLMNYYKMNKSILDRYNKVMTEREQVCRYVKNILETKVSKKFSLYDSFMTRLNRDLIADNVKFEKIERKVINTVRDLQGVFKSHALGIIIRKLKPHINEKDGLSELSLLKPLIDSDLRILYSLLERTYLVYRYTALPEEYTSQTFIQDLNLSVLITFNQDVVKLVKNLRNDSFNFEDVIALDLVGTDDYV